jgi:hypothetical protein
MLRGGGERELGEEETKRMWIGVFGMAFSLGRGLGGGGMGIGTSFFLKR